MIKINFAKIDFFVRLFVFFAAGLSSAFFCGILLAFFGLEAATVLYSIVYFIIIIPVFEGFVILYGLASRKFSFYFTLIKQFNLTLKQGANQSLFWIQFYIKRIINLF